MEIVIIIFLGLTIFLFFAFVNFDRLLRIEYNEHKELWIKDGKPKGFFWKPLESNWFGSTIAMQRLSMQWIFKSPNWVKGDIKAEVHLKKLRIFVFIWNMGIIILFVIMRLFLS